jgi:hypothetical protein
MMTPEERAEQVAEAWPSRPLEAIAAAIREAENDALERAAKHMAAIFGREQADAVRRLKHV